MIVKFETISVVIPVFNREKFVEKALKSVVSQTIMVDEIIVVDDGSKDSTFSLIGNMMMKYPFIRYVYQKNCGPSAARNTGIKVAKGKYIAFLDSDDVWTKDKLEIQLSQMKVKKNYLISHTREKWYRRGEHLNQKKKHFPGNDDIFNRCLKMCVVGMSTVVARRELFEKYGMFDENLRCCEDYDLWLRIALKEYFLLVDNQLTIKHGGREDQVSNQFRVGMDKYRIYSLEKIASCSEIEKYPEKKVKLLDELRKKCIIYGRGCIKHGRYHEGKKYLDKWL